MGLGGYKLTHLHLFYIDRSLLFCLYLALVQEDICPGGVFRDSLCCVIILSLILFKWQLCTSLFCHFWPFFHTTEIQKVIFKCLLTLESGIDVGKGISIGPGKFVKKNKCRALNKPRAWRKCANLCYKKPIKLENICRPWKKFKI